MCWNDRPSLIGMRPGFVAQLKAAGSPVETDGVQICPPVTRSELAISRLLFERRSLRSSSVKWTPDLANYINVALTEQRQIF